MSKSYISNKFIDFTMFSRLGNTDQKFGLLFKEPSIKNFSTKASLLYKFAEKKKGPFDDEIVKNMLRITRDKSDDEDIQSEFQDKAEFLEKIDLLLIDLHKGLDSQIILDNHPGLTENRISFQHQNGIQDTKINFHHQPFSDAVRNLRQNLHQCKHQGASEVEGRKCLESEFHFCEHREARNFLANTAVYEKLRIIEEENMLAEGAEYVESKLLAMHCHRSYFVTEVFSPSPECIFGFLHDTQYWERREPQSFESFLSKVDKFIEETTENLSLSHEDRLKKLSDEIVADSIVQLADNLSKSVEWMRNFSESQWKAIILAREEFAAESKELRQDFVLLAEIGFIPHFQDEILPINTQTAEDDFIGVTV
jgi:hypothetical protein